MQESSPLSLTAENKKTEQDHLRPVTRPGAFSVSHVPQTPPSTPGKASRFVVIHADLKRKKRTLAEDGPARRLSSRVRHILVMLITLAILAGTLITLVPLATNQGNVSLPSNLRALINSTRSDWQNLISQNQPQATSTSSLPTMTIPHSQLVTLAEQDASAAGISPVYFTRQINKESGFNPNAVSPSGAEGIAQFEPSTAAGLGIDPFNPTQALQAAAQMMARYAKQYGGYDKALAAYNAGPANLQNAENSCGAKWLSCMPAQTQNYVSAIIGG
jgi:soluble lytic murein transglycosylase-like protein